MERLICNCFSFSLEDKTMSGFIKICREEIEESLIGTSRQYIVGDLQKPQQLNHIQNEDVEIGITNYNEYATEVVHRHNKVTEYQYMLDGWTIYKDIETGEEFEFKKGDFYCIKSGTTYAQKSKKGTRILFIKVPSIDDKEQMELTEEIKKWYEEGLKTVRKDYFHQDNMPEANSVRPASAVAIINDNKILMLKRRDNSKWTMPGGTLEMDENMVECAVREVKEELGLDITIKDIIGTYTDPDIRVEYSDGEVRREFTIVYYGTSLNTEIVIDDESSAYAWIDLDHVDNYPMADSQRRRVEDVIKFLKTGKRNFG